MQRVIVANADRLMALPNVIGVGSGEKDGRPAVIVFVTHKVPITHLGSDEVVPRELHGYPTDVVPIGAPHALEQSMPTKRGSEPNQSPDGRSGPELDPVEAASMLSAKDQAVVDILNGGYPNVVGVGTGMKWTNGTPTGRKAVLVLVNQKIGDEALPSSHRVPASIGGTPTDVVGVGDVMAGHSVQDVDALTLTSRQRPARPGYSVGHVNITAGTIGAAVYDLLPGGIGMPPKYYLLSTTTCSPTRTRRASAIRSSSRARSTAVCTRVTRSAP